MARPRYRGIVYDSARWEGFEPRPGDIVISTPPKCGTTWTQMICYLLIFQESELDRPLAEISPWLDNTGRSRRQVVSDLDAQTHRRFIKTHTPLDGLPVDPSVTYLCVGRDPRDVALSMDNHMDNLDIPEFLRLRAEAARLDGIELEPLPAPPVRAEDPRERFWRWVEEDPDPTATNASLRSMMSHLKTFWAAPDPVDVVFLHYDDLQADLGGQMRTLAEKLGIEVPGYRWPTLVEAATFDAMRQKPEVTVPGVEPTTTWRDPARFFHKGTSGQWRQLLNDADVARYAERVRSLGPPDLVSWVHRADPAIVPT